MPAKSRKQQRYLQRKFGHAWVREHHYTRLATGGGGRGRSSPTKRSPKKRKRR